MWRVPDKRNKEFVVVYDKETGIADVVMPSGARKGGDTVTAGQQIGVSGNTGTRTTGPHLHFSVKQVAEDGTKRDIDPASYLAEIAQRGGIGLTAMYNGKDLLEKFKSPESKVRSSKSRVEGRVNFGL